MDRIAKTLGLKRRYQSERVGNKEFQLGATVTTTKNIAINYPDCVSTTCGTGMYYIPAGSVGTIISARVGFSQNPRNRFAVRFLEVENCPGLYWGGDIGPGHYIGEEFLQLAEVN